MPQQVIRYKCIICETEYKTKAAALSCEDLGTPINQFEIGEVISFMMEEYSETGRLVKKAIKAPVSQHTISLSKYGHINTYTIEEKIGSAIVAKLTVLQLPSGTLISPISEQRTPH